MISVLVAFHDDPTRHRGRVWAYIRALLERDFPDWEVVVGSDDGTPFSKAAALNRAAERAYGDIFYVLDADTWVASERVSAALRVGGWVKPFCNKLKLLESDTERLLLDPTWDGDVTGISTFEHQTSFWPAPPFFIPREMWEAVNGMDERFRGWGQEDEAFGLSVQALFGPPSRLFGMAVHMWHPRIGTAGKDRWEGQTHTNVELVEGYRVAGRRAESMTEFLEARDG